MAGGRAQEAGQTIKRDCGLSLRIGRNQSNRSSGRYRLRIVSPSTSRTRKITRKI
jgi:hypothetical protein